MKSIVTSVKPATQMLLYDSEIVSWSHSHHSEIVLLLIKIVSLYEHSDHLEIIPSLIK